MRAALLVLLAALLLAACGGGDDSGSASSHACPSDAVVIKMANIKFDPEKATAGVGETVCWENDDTVDHDAVANSGADFKSPLFGKGKTFSTKIDSPGTVQYECTVHPGMTGEITVEKR
jgi:plastocyanin